MSHRPTRPITHQHSLPPLLSIYLSWFTTNVLWALKMNTAHCLQHTATPAHSQTRLTLTPALTLTFFGPCPKGLTSGQFVYLATLLSTLNPSLTPLCCPVLSDNTLTSTSLMIWKTTTSYQLTSLTLPTLLHQLSTGYHDLGRWRWGASRSSTTLLNSTYQCKHFFWILISTTLQHFWLHPVYRWRRLHGWYGWETGHSVQQAAFYAVPRYQSVWRYVAHLWIHECLLQTYSHAHTLYLSPSLSSHHLHSSFFYSSSSASSTCHSALAVLLSS